MASTKAIRRSIPASVSSMLESERSMSSSRRMSVAKLQLAEGKFGSDTALGFGGERGTHQKLILKTVIKSPAEIAGLLEPEIVSMAIFLELGTPGVQRVGHL